MKRTRITIAGTAGIVFILALPAHSYFQDGYELRQKCQTIEWYCLGYIEGAIDGLNSAASSLVAATLLCLPSEMRVGQAELVVKGYLNSHPQDLHKPAADLVSVALREAFPCGKTR
jgi:hypothetical protein